MKKQKDLSISVCMLGAFLLWTAAVRFVDVQAIGPLGSCVGFATVNQFVHNLTGRNMSLYILTDWLGLVPAVFAAGFALAGLIQWIKGKHIKKVDYRIRALGGFYAVLMGAYLLFETVVINYRPVLINGNLEPSYPSSTTMLVMCVMPTAAMLLRSYIKNNVFRQCVVLGMDLFVAFMVIGRLLAGVHWVTDIVGGALLSTGLVRMYRFVCALEEK